MDSEKTRSKRKPNSYEVQKRYDDKATKRYGLKFNLEYDKDVIERLDSVPNKNNYVRQLVRKDLCDNQLGDD